MHPDKHAAAIGLNVTPALGLRTPTAPKKGTCTQPRAYQTLRRPALQPGHFVNLIV
ncbi:MAG: hypothetical protein NXH95_16510 [Pseudomonadaceae bacterium]|nr:hypothetical protein [Pseudomonadaceae bacterium]